MTEGGGGTAPAPAGYVPPSLPGVAAGSFSGILRARLIIVSGPTGAVEGLFVYTAGTTPGLGNPPVISITNQTQDPFGNTVPQGFADTVGGIRAVLGPAGADLMALVFNALVSPANTGPRLGVIQATSAGCKAEVTSGLSLPGSVAATVGLTDSTFTAGPSDIALQSGNLDLTASNLITIGALALATWNDVTAQLSLPAGGGPFILGESFHVIANASGVGGTLRVKKLPWNAVWIDCECTFAYTAAAQTFIMGSLPDATYYPTTARRFPVSVTGTPSGITATFPRLFVPTSGAVQIVVPSGTVASGINISGSFMYPTN